jgi:hypothetical protein
LLRRFLRRLTWLAFPSRGSLQYRRYGFLYLSSVHCHFLYTQKELLKARSLDADIFCVYSKTMSKRGRPLKPTPQKREERLDLRVSTVEKMAFKLAAENSQQDLSVWIRVQLHRAAGEELAKAETLEPNLKEISDGKHG